MIILNYIALLMTAVCLFVFYREEDTPWFIVAAVLFVVNLIIVMGHFNHA